MDGNKVGVEHLLVLVGNGLNALVLVKLVSDVLRGIDNIEQLPWRLTVDAVFPFGDGIAVEGPPAW